MVIDMSKLVTVAWQPHDFRKLGYLYGLYSSVARQQRKNFVCAFQYGVLGQVWYLKVSIPDLYILLYLKKLF